VRAGAAHLRQRRLGGWARALAARHAAERGLGDGQARGALQGSRGHVSAAAVQGPGFCAQLSR
jgi:hypothetical protein